MRLYPPGVFLIREPLTEDFHLMDITIPKGTWIHVRLMLLLSCNFRPPALCLCQLPDGILTFISVIHIANGAHTVEVSSSKLVAFLRTARGMQTRAANAGSARPPRAFLHTCHMKRLRMACVRHVRSVIHLCALACMHYRARSYTNTYVSAGPCHCALQCARAKLFEASLFN